MKKIILFVFGFGSIINLFAQMESYATDPDLLLPLRLPLPNDLEKVERIDLDKDGDPDMIKYYIYDQIPVIWIDDDDDMKASDFEGDLDNDCMLIDRNKDGLFAGPFDFCVDYGDEDNNGIADLQLVIDNGDPTIRNKWDWSSNIMWFIDDGEEDANFSYIDWNRLNMRCWEHYGHSNFYTDYHGQNTFTKMNVSSFRLHDFRYSWENPFYFFDIDNDTHSEMSIRLEDTPVFRDKPQDINGREDPKLFQNLDEEIDAAFIGVLDKVYISFDLDNDNSASNEFDFDLSLQFNGEHGYDYNHMKQSFKSIDGLKDADQFMFDSRWRHLTELIYPERDAAWDIIFKNGNWEECWFSFDEDDDCNRWERVELLQPKEIFNHGMLKNGIDHNPQADEMGDRGEFDLDNSGKGNLYIATFDGRFHLYGAEWGVWRIDQDAYSFQGYGGLYNRSAYVRSQFEAEIYATIKYSDSDNNGFIDFIEYDLDGDKLYEHSLSYFELGLNDETSVIELRSADYQSISDLYSKLSETIWIKSQQAVKLVEKIGLNSQWYSLYKQAESVQEKYSFGYWLNFYCYLDIRNYFIKLGDREKVIEADKAYLSGDWNSFNL